MDEEFDLLSLLEKEQLTDEELQWLSNYLESHSDEIFSAVVRERFLTKLVQGRNLPSERAHELLAELHEQIGYYRTAGSPVQRIHFLRRSWWKYAAAVILIFSSVAYLWFNDSKPLKTAQTTLSEPLQDVPAPSDSRAILTLASGQRILLDSTSTGSLAVQGDVVLSKLANGQLVYSGKSDALLHNTLTNPRGSKAIAMTLADGTRIWLNSESSITYPAAFAGKERRVAITGEAYFEVAPDASKPFKVNKGELEIMVLGTHFNVSAYDDEQLRKVTLLQGKVRLKDSRTPENPQTLAPGEQAVLTESEIEIRNPDITEVMAWKNGLFRFNDASMETIMKEVSRWYNAEVVFEGKVEGNFVVGISRDVPVSKLLYILELTNRVHFTIDGNRIIVRP